MLKDCNLDSNTLMILFLNDSDWDLYDHSERSDLCSDPERAVMDKVEIASQSVFSHTISLFLS